MVLRDILEKASKDTPGRNPIDRMIGDHYTACMDEKGIEAKGTKPIKAVLDRVAALPSKEALAGEVARLHPAGVNVLFRFRSVQDFKDATSVIAIADQGGLGLPDRDYYTKEDPRSVEIREKYVAHVGKMFGLLGDSPEAAAAGAKTVMEIETALAKVSLERVKRRDPANIYHKMPLAELVSLTPGFSWKDYLAGIRAPETTSLNVAVPDFFKGLETIIASTDLEKLKTYLRWQTVHAASDILPSAFVDEDFDFYGRTLSGSKELRPRWKRCVDRTDDELGEALGQRYVEATFGADGKERMLRMVVALEKALAEDIRTLPWMTETTKKQALAKLDAIANKIGYPDEWRDYSSVRISRDDAVGNSQRAGAFEFARQLGKIGKPVDKREWQMTPPTVNAYYNPLMNNINFPAGILQPPFFDRKMDDAVNFGGIGAVIGHELTHGFDDQGRKFAPNGTLQDWWTEQDGKEFESRATCIADQYSGYTAVADVKLNGRLTLGENTADNGGLRIAYMALKDTLKGKKVASVDGYTPEQRIFLGWAQVWCQNRTDEIARMLAQVDSHSPGEYRVNGVVSNMPEFQEAYQCKAGSAMTRENACRVW
jgi:endothelin-converting enzyme/putative endopeptidase